MHLILLVLSLLLCQTVSPVEASKGHSISFHQPSTVDLCNKRFDLAKDEELSHFVIYAEKIISELQDERKALENRSRKILANQSRDDLSQAEINKLQREEPRSLAKKDIRGLAAMVRLAKASAQDQSAPHRHKIQQQILELAYAVANNHRSPTPRYIGPLDLPFRFLRALHHPVAKGTKPASNLAACRPDDLSRADPEQSSYWRRPALIRSLDLYTGFNRAELPRFDNCTWTYSGPKKVGGNPGYDLVSGEQRLKIKFGEIHSEPFISRIFDALGYHVDPTDYTPLLKVKYDRRLLREFNLRPDMKMRAGLFFVPVHTFNFQKIHDPFDFIDHAVLKSGNILSSAELKKAIFRNPFRKHPEWYPENFRTELETQIDYIVTSAANIQIDRDHLHTVGPWGFGGLGREHLRELRGAGVLAAWLGWWDSRFENTRLRIVKTEQGEELQHLFSDLGGGLGRSAGTFRHSNEKPNDFAWSFTRGGLVRRSGAAHWQFEIANYEPIEDTPAFENITIDDARWMGRLIAQLSERQIKDALIASGFEPAEVGVYSEKLISRRNHLIHDLQLASEIPPLLVNQTEQQISLSH